jgi:hypothetical protein
MHLTTRSTERCTKLTLLQLTRSQSNALTHTFSLGTIAILWAGSAIATQPPQEISPDPSEPATTHNTEQELAPGNSTPTENSKEISSLQGSSGQPSAHFASEPTLEPQFSIAKQSSFESHHNPNYEWRPRKYAILRTPFSVYTHFYVNQYRDNLPDAPTDAPVESSQVVAMQNNPALEEEKPERDEPLTTPTVTEADSTQVESAPAAPTDKPQGEVLRQGSQVLGTPSIRLQGAYLQEGEAGSARARATVVYPVSPNALFGAEVDLTSGNGFSDSPGTGLDLNELYFAVSPQSLPQLRFVVGLMDLTSYFDRNSFAKDATTHFFNRAFQTNPALAAAGIASRPGALVNWSVTDNVDIKAAAFSSRRNLGDLALDSFAGEVGFRTGNLIIRGTYVTSRDAGKDTGFEEIFQIARGNGDFGLDEDDRETAFGINAEYFIPKLKLGLFGRYGWYNNTDIDEGGNTFSFGLNLLDLFLPSDRFGIAYGRQLSNNDLRRDNDDDIPDVLEVFYDIRLARNLRAGVMLQERNGFSETVVGFRIKTELNLTGRR